MKSHPHFFAYLARMKLIDRWSLMRCTQRENVQEHSLQVAILAHALCLIKNKYFEGRVNAENVALKAIFHDATEVLTGDLPTPVKYFNDEIREAYNQIEEHAVDQLMKLLPPEFIDDYRSLLSEDPETKAIIKAADTLAAYLKCVEEEAAGNREFSRAKKSIEAKLQEFRKRAPEVEYFMTTFVPSFSLTLDELSEPLEL
jgi:5'-deoxynucleotidase